jgi:hypothetical protein
MLAASVCAPVVRGADDVAGNLMLVNENGAWSWFEDERAIVDPNTGNVLVGSIANGAGTGSTARHGSVEVYSFNLADRQVHTSSFGQIQADDHNTPALLVRPDGRYLAAYAEHSINRLTRTKISAFPGNATAWTDPPAFTNAANATYNNLFRLSAEGKTYNFTRTVGFDPNFLVSTNDGDSWSYGGKLLQDPANSNSTRPYLKYASNDVDRIDFITTEGHPRDFNNGIYHGYLEGGKLYRTDGTEIGNLGSSPSAQAFTPVFSPTASRNRAWTTDLSLDASGNPVAVFTTRVDSLGAADHRFFYGRYVGGTWQVNEIAKAGAGLYPTEGDYTGLAAIDPRDPSTLYISSPFNPATSAATSNHEIYKGVTSNNGASWTWTPVTQNSTVDNLRPIVPKWSGGTALMWMRGTYSSYTNYGMAIVGLVQQDGQTTGDIRYTDASPSNTTRADGTPVFPSGPGAGPGTDDGRWHLRTGVGNGNQVFTAGEIAPENVPALKTTTPTVDAGQYDVFGFFWADPSQDWQIAMGLSDFETRIFRQDFAEQAASLEFENAGMVLTSDGMNLYKAYLGRVTLTSSEAISVFTDDTQLGVSSANQTWFDGIGISAVVPEPGVTVPAVALCGAGILRRKRRRFISL